jgi:hypothetical protein
MENEMSNAQPLNDQTFLSKFRQDLENGGMFPDMAQAVLDSVVEGEKSSSMAGRWMDDPAGYPAMMYNVLWMLVKTYALTYIDKHAPAAWFRPVFLPVKEQMSFLEETRGAHRSTEASAADPAGMLYKKDLAVVADTVVSIGKSPVECPSLDTLVSVANMGKKILPLAAHDGSKLRLLPHQSTLYNHFLKVPVRTMEVPVKAFALRDGGAYLNRLGQRVEVKQVAVICENDPFCFEQTNGPPHLFMVDGRYNDSFGEPVNDLDLIEEIVPLHSPNSIARFNDRATTKPISMRPLQGDNNVEA